MVISRLTRSFVVSAGIALAVGCGVNCFDDLDIDIGPHVFYINLDGVVQPVLAKVRIDFLLII